MPFWSRFALPSVFLFFISFIFPSLCFGATSPTFPGRYILVLQDPPVSLRFSARADLETDAAVAYRRQIEAKQAAVKTVLAAKNIGVTGSVSILGNYLFVAAGAERVDEMRAIPGVVDVRPMRKFKKTLDRATQVLNGPAAWTALGGISNAGLGMKIGILDSGIDQNHPAFNDPTLLMPAGFPKCTTGHPEDCAYTNNKVIVARSYVRLLAAPSNPNNPAADDVPDDYSPRDRDGHGTGVASSAAANVTTTPGVTSTGASLVIQGMAPKAYLGNYKLAGSPGVDEFASDQTLIQAVEDAFTDGMDVITTSWGANATSDYASDPVASAFETAATAKGGPVVLAAAGNNGEQSLFQGANYPGFNSIVSPSNAPDVISVGATENSHVMLPAVTLNGANVPSSLLGIPAQPSDSFNYPSSQGANTAPIVDATSIGGVNSACGALPAGSLLGPYGNGAIALIQQGSSACTFTVQATNAQAAGAIGLIIYSASSASPGLVEGVGFNNSSDAGFIGPVVAVSNASGLSLQNFIDANPRHTVTIAAGAIEMDLSAWSQQYGYTNPIPSSMNVSGFSSFGPTPDSMMKPDIVAVGGNDIGFLFPDPNNDLFVPAPNGIYMATQSYDPNTSLQGGSDFGANGYWAADGTSFATPLTAGAAALVKQAHPGLRGTQIRSLLVNTASQVVTMDDGGDPVDAEWIGNGLLDAGAAIAGTITAEPATISFGAVNNATFPIAKQIVLTNIGKSSATLTASTSCCQVNSGGGFVTPGSLTGATLALSSNNITLAAGASTTLTVTLSGKAPLAGEYSGSVLLSQGTTPVAQIPFMLLEGDGVPYNVLTFLGSEGPPGGDAGAQIVQVTDQYGAAVAGTPVAFSISPRGAFTLQSVSGEPSCAASGASVTCNTDQFGFAYAELINGNNARAASVSATAAGLQFSGNVNIQNPPKITAVNDAASGATTVAPGSYVAIYGTGLANTTLVNGAAYNPNGAFVTVASDPVIANGYVLPLQLGTDPLQEASLDTISATTVSFDVPSVGLSVPAHIVFVSPTQINIQVPWELQGQSSAQMKVTIDGDLFGNVVTVPLANAAPSMFTYNGAAIAQDPSYTTISSGNPARRGTTIVLYTNGLGPVNNQPNSGDPAGVSPTSTCKTLPTVTIGGQNAQVAYAGLVPSLPGLYQLNVTVPTNIGAGTQSITISAGGVTSPASTLPVQ